MYIQTFRVFEKRNSSSFCFILLFYTSEISAADVSWVGQFLFFLFYSTLVIEIFTFFLACDNFRNGKIWRIVACQLQQFGPHKRPYAVAAKLGLLSQALRKAGHPERRSTMIEYDEIR